MHASFFLNAVKNLPLIFKNLAMRSFVATTLRDDGKDGAPAKTPFPFLPNSPYPEYPPQGDISTGYLPGPF